VSREVYVLRESAGRIQTEAPSGNSFTSSCWTHMEPPEQREEAGAMSAGLHQRCHSLSEEANGNHADPGPEPEELDWDSYSTTLEHRLSAVGNSYWLLNTSIYILYIPQKPSLSELFSSECARLRPSSAHLILHILFEWHTLSKDHAETPKGHSCIMMFSIALASIRAGN